MSLPLILLVLFLLGSPVIIGIGMLILYNLERFGLQNDPMIGRISLAFKTGILVLANVNLVLLFLAVV